MKSDFDRICPSGNISQSMYPYSPDELERDEDEREIECGFCLDTHGISDWRTYMKALRVARTLRGNEWLNEFKVSDMLSTCRGIKTGWKSSISGRICHEEDCPICFNK